MGWTSLRVVLGLALGFVGAVAVGVAIRYFALFGKLTLPTITLLTPISPVAWLPVAIFIFGIGNVPAIPSAWAWTRRASTKTATCCWR